ncbi:sulfite exporter TauE/SafE family protein [Candidatus Poribacteria bacterium]|nr:sulfite exporter TauE/SafE family protein [Candidatus Poribacteria bacterium]
MTIYQIILICAGLLIISFLYSSVGHAGASGYIAVMSLAGLSPDFIKPTVLFLNIIVAIITSWQFYRAGHFTWNLFWPFILLSIPMAFLGGRLNLSVHVFKITIGIILLYSAIRFIIPLQGEEVIHQPKLLTAVLTGAGLGFLSGITGTGGGIFLTPTLIFFKWARTKAAAAVSSFFILINSIFGLLGNISSTKDFPMIILPFVIVVLIGGVFGSYLGSKKFSSVVIKKLLASVLTLAGLKLIFI